jgi:glutathione S-transferase/GST-like protein
MVTLYHWEPNANSGKPMLTLAEKGVEYQSHYLDLLKFDQHQPEYLRINPDGTIPAMVHGDLVLTESTPMMEYIDDAFPGPPLRPSDPRLRWSIFIGPAVRQRDPEELRAAIDRIPLESRRIAWRKAIYNEFSEQELAESRRRVVFATDVLEAHLRRNTWICGDAYSLGDINGFNLGYALPLSQPERCNDQRTPHIMEWLRKIYERPATRATWSKGRTQMAARVKMLERSVQP